MKKFSLKLIAAVVLSTSFLYSCKSDDDSTTDPNPTENTDALPKDETWVIFNGTEKWSGGIYALSDNKAREINLSTIPFYQVGYSAGGRVKIGRAHV